MHDPCEPREPCSFEEMLEEPFARLELVAGAHYGMRLEALHERLAELERELDAFLGDSQRARGRARQGTRNRAP
jgi:hypothetical protein